LAGWIDFNGNGVFDAAEKSNVATCPAGTNNVSLNWTTPVDFVPQTTSYMRLRTAVLAANIANPTGPSPNGEAEDYRIASHCQAWPTCAPAPASPPAP
jgi:large repetitive protein